MFAPDGHSLCTEQHDRAYPYAHIRSLTQVDPTMGVI